MGEHARVVVGVVAALVGGVAFYWTALNAARVLRQPELARPIQYVRIALGLAVVAAVGGSGVRTLLGLWREGGDVTIYLVKAALPLAFAFGVSWGIRGAMRRRIVSRTGVLTGRQAVEYGVLMALLAAAGLVVSILVLLG